MSEVDVQFAGDRVRVVCGKANVSWSLRQATYNSRAYTIVANAAPGAIDDLLEAVAAAARIYPAAPAGVDGVDSYTADG